MCESPWNSKIYGARWTSAYRATYVCFNNPIRVSLATNVPRIFSRMLEEEDRRELSIESAYPTINTRDRELESLRIKGVADPDRGRFSI